MRLFIYIVFGLITIATLFIYAMLPEGAIQSDNVIINWLLEQLPVISVSMFVALIGTEIFDNRSHRRLK